MNQARCKKCGQVFAFAGLPPPVCPACQKARNEQLYILRMLVREFKGLSAADLNRITGVPVNVILQTIQGGEMDYIPVEESPELEAKVQEAMAKARG